MHFPIKRRGPGEIPARQRLDRAAVAAAVPNAVSCGPVTGAFEIALALRARSDQAASC